MADETSPSHPRRIQRKRTKGWKMPEGAIYVGRPTKWGNPWIPGQWYGRRLTPTDCVEAFRLSVRGDVITAARTELRGKNLACWCPLDQPCHADVLLEIANAE